MTQRDKVKELVGRGLNSYHTKSLQQIDRIEKKNKEQNHKISILSNELDNDYLTKTEEGSVVSLEHSKEGMVYLDKLQGNTLVNYCTDGSKELTLNGDIDLEGTFVTTTEGVDGGKVDVLCEGNTLILDENGNEVEAGSEGARLVSVGQDDENGHKIEILSHNNFLGMNDDNITLRSFSSRQGFNKFTIIGSESWNSEVHFNVNSSDVPIGTNIKIRIKVLENTNPSMNNSILKSWELTDFNVGNFDYSLLNEWQEIEYNVNREYNGSADSKINLMIFGLKNTALPTDRMVAEIEVEINNSKKSNKKEILLNEPLRGLPNGVKDRFVKISGKWFIERRYKEVVLADININTYSLSDEYPDVFGFYFTPTDIKNTSTIHSICNFLPVIPTHFPGYLNRNYEGISNSYEHIKGCVLKNKLDEVSRTGLINYFSKVDARIAYELKTPIYEPLEINPELLVYNDVAHISNNSLIPCNMKVKNSGYNAIIKPSTLYTVALDTNKSGTIGMNLGGAKGITTNNVLTLTTPATLTDDSLRLHGKGIKGSKVRLLEGDKTNWIPSFFEGMKSSFEDKLQDDGTYKMEILSYTKKLQNQLLNPNLKTHPFQKTTIDGDWNVFQWNIGDYYISTKDVIDGDKFKNGDKVYVKFDVIKLSDAHYTDTIWCGRIGGYNTIIFSGEFYNLLPINQQKTLKTIITHNPPDSDPRTFKIDFGGFRRDIECKFKIKDITVVNLTRLYGKGNEPTIEWCDENIPYYNTNDMHYVDMNKIQFSSIEPLRSLPNGTKDKFIFRDGKLMIERNTKSILFNGSEDWKYRETRTDGHCYTLNISDLKKYGINSYTQGYVDRFFMRHLLPFGAWFEYLNGKDICLQLPLALGSANTNAIKNWLNVNNVKVVYEIEIPTYEEIPFELQKIILEGYENGTLFFDTNIPPTSTVTYAGETPIVKSVKLNKTEVSSNTDDINDNIIPYLMDMDYRVVCLQLATEEIEGGVSMARLFGGAYEMLKRDILSKRLTREEYGYRLIDYFNAGKLTEQEVRELEDLK